MPMPTDPICADHYKAGWNNTEYGVNNWTGGSRWKTPLAWVKEMKLIASGRKAETKEEHGKAYFDGVIECADQFEATGKVERIERLSSVEISAQYPD